jgi:aminopeptidase
MDNLYVSPRSKLIELIKYCRIPFELGAKPGQSVLVITDADMDPNVWQAVAAAANGFGLETVTMMMADPREHHGIAPPAPIVEAMLVPDIVISVTTKELHTGGFHQRVREAGHAFVIMEQTNAEMLTGPAVRADYKLMNEVGMPAFVDTFNKAGGTWHITSKFGTDFTCQVKPGTAKAMASKPVGGKLVSFPDGQGSVIPVPGTGEGVIVIDTSIHYPEGLLKEPIRWLIKKGYVTDIQGGVEAQQLKEWMKESCDAPIAKYEWEELSIGFNPLCPITGILRTDKKHYGKLHTAITGRGKHPTKGENVRLHIDGVIHEPTIAVNGKILVDNAVIKIPPLDTWAHN